MPFLTHQIAKNDFKKGLNWGPYLKEELSESYFLLNNSNSKEN